jgi:hypothetical protein
MGRGRAFLPWILAGTFGAAADGASAQEIAVMEERPAEKPAIGRLALSAKVGSTGPAADLTWGWSRELHGRFSISYEPQLDRKDDNPIRATGSLLLDWHPSGGSFRLSGGLAYLRREFQDGSPYGPTVGSNELAPYFGIGWGNPFRAGSRWKFVVDLGAFHGGGIVYSSGSDSSRASTSSASESSNLRVTASWSPVIASGVSFRF